MRHVLFRLGREHFALPLSAAREVVVPPTQWSRVPRAPLAVRGVMNLRGRVVPGIDLHRLLQLPGEVPEPQKLVLLDRGRRDLGLLVTEVDGIDSLEKISAAPGPPARAVRGMARLKGWAVTVLEPEGLEAAVVAVFHS